MVWKWCRPLIEVPLPPNTVWPFSALKPCSRPSPSAPTTQMMGSATPSVVVTIGAPPPLNFAHQAKLIGDAPPPPAPPTQVMGSATPSVVVTIGAPPPLNFAHQAKLIGEPPLAATFSMVTLLPEQWLLPELVKATMVWLSV